MKIIKKQWIKNIIYILMVTRKQKKYLDGKNFMRNIINELDRQKLLHFIKILLLTS